MYVTRDPLNVGINAPDVVGAFMAVAMRSFLLWHSLTHTLLSRSHAPSVIHCIQHKLFHYILVPSCVMFSVLRKGVIPVKSFARRAMSDAFVFNGVSAGVSEGASVVDSSFTVKEGAKIALMGSNESGE
jgi:hypothetical protein